MRPGALALATTLGATLGGAIRAALAEPLGVGVLGATGAPALAAAVATAPAARPAPPRLAVPLPPSQEAGITVFAAASLTEAFGEAAGAFERRHPGTRVRLSFGGSQQLAAQLRLGAEADLFAPADERAMAAVRRAGLLADTSVVFARNRLVVITPASNPGRVDRLADLARPGVKLVLAAEAVPAGRYARDLLDRLSGAPGFGPDFRRRVLRNLVSEEENVRAVVGKVRLGEADAGVVYRSDLSAAPAGAIRVLEVPDRYNVVAAYPIARLRASPRGAVAEAFVRFLLSADGQAILVRHGFMPRDGGASRSPAPPAGAGPR